MLLIAKFNHEESSIELPDEVVEDFLRSVYTRSRTGHSPTVKSCYIYMRARYKSDEFERWAGKLKGYYVAIINTDKDKTYIHLRKCRSKNQHRA